MKGVRKFVYGVLLFVLIFGMTGCVPRLSKPEQFTQGFVDLLTKPLDKIEETEEIEYADNLTGELRELINTRSHEMSTTIEIEDLGGLDYMGLDIGRGSRLELDTAYDVNTGDGMAEVNVVNLANVLLGIQNDEIAVDLSSPFMQEMVVVEFNSDLDFEDEVTIMDRLADLMNALDVSDSSSEDLLADLQTDIETLLERYAGVVAAILEEDQIGKDSQEMEILGEDTKVEVLTLEMDERDLEDILAEVLNYAEEDDELVDVVMKYAKDILPIVWGYEPDSSELGDFEDELQDSIGYAADDLADAADYWDNMDITMDIYYTTSGFLSRLIPSMGSKEPVAVGLAIETDYAEVSMFLKFVEEDDQRDFALDISYDDDYSQGNAYIELLTDGQEFLLSADGEINGDQSFSVDVTNVKDGSEYILEGEMDITTYDVLIKADINGVTIDEGDMQSSEIEISGSFEDLYWGDTYEADLVISTESTQERDTQYNEMEISGSIVDAWDDTYEVKLVLSNELTQVRSGSTYESVTDISGEVTFYGETISADLSVETTWDFSDDIVVDLPDFNDPDAQRFNVEELFEDIPNLLYYFW